MENKFRAMLNEEGNPEVKGKMIFSEPFPVVFWTWVEAWPLNSVVEMYTGLKDSKGVEIYEGDPVRVTLSSGRKIKAVIKFTDGCFEVEAKDPEFRTRSEYHSKRDYLKCYTVNHAVEVIGSIRENPELLED